MNKQKISQVAEAIIRQVRQFIKIFFLVLFLGVIGFVNGKFAEPALSAAKTADKTKLAVGGNGFFDIFQSLKSKATAVPGVTDAIDYVDALAPVAPNNMFVAYGSTSCPAGFSTAYTGVLVGLWANSATTLTNFMGLDNSSQASMSVVCLGSQRTAPGGIWGYAHSGYAHHPITNPGTYDQAVSCAVCVR